MVVGMKNEICLLICSNYYLELKTILKNEDIKGVVIESFYSDCAQCKKNSHINLENIINKKRNLYSKFHLISSSGCLDNEDINKKFPELEISETKLCFNFIINQNIINTYLEKNYYITSPGWLNKWEHYVIDIWKFDRNTAREFFKENTSKLLLLDTGVYQNSIHKMQQFSDYLDIPFEVLNVGLEYLTLFIKNIILELKYKANIEYQEEQRKISLLQNQKISDYSMVFDWLGSLPQIVDEKVIIDKIFDLVKIIFAAKKIIYISLGEKEKINMITSFPHGCDKSELINIYQTANLQDYQWTRSGNGFCVKIHHNKTDLGIILIDELMFPEYKEKYLNNFLNIINIFGLAIHSSKVYSKLLKTEDNLILKESNFQQLFKNSPESIMALDKNLKIKDVNYAFLEMFHYSKNDVIGMTFSDILLCLENTKQCIEYINQIKEGETVKKDIKIKSLNNAIMELQMLGYPIKNADKIMGYYIFLSDISLRKDKEEQIKKMAYEDSLTGLQNKRSFEINFEKVLSRYISKKDKFALFIIDLNKFKKINDTFGHKVGDDVLIKTAQKLKECTRKSDMVFRIGGDEFAFIMSRGSNNYEMKIMSDRILKNLDVRLSTLEYDLKISASIGISICPDDGIDLETLYKKADKNMYEAKKILELELSLKNQKNSRS